MKIGTDVSLDVCRNEGYLMMEFKKRELIKKGVLDPECDVRFYQHLPDYCLRETYGTERPVGTPTICLNVWLNANDIWDLYQRNAKSIDETCGINDREFPQDEYDLLSLASDIDGYSGLA